MRIVVRDVPLTVDARIILLTGDQGAFLLPRMSDAVVIECAEPTPGLHRLVEKLAEADGRVVEALSGLGATIVSSVVVYGGHVYTGSRAAPLLATIAAILAAASGRRLVACLPHAPLDLIPVLAEKLAEGRGEAAIYMDEVRAYRLYEELEKRGARSVALLEATATRNGFRARIAKRIG